MLPLKYLSRFWRTLKISLSNCDINLFLTWSEKCVIIASAIDNQVPIFTITDTKLYVPFVTSSARSSSAYRNKRLHIYG